MQARLVEDENRREARIASEAMVDMVCREKKVTVDPSIYRIVVYEVQNRFR
jgi:hypothetical protein